MTDTKPMAPTDATLQRRCAEIVEWQRKGILPGNALREYAAAQWAGHTDSLQMAERDTATQAMEWIAKWGVQPVPAGYALVPVEPTPEMLSAMWVPPNSSLADTYSSLSDAYNAMLAAAPQPVARKPLTDEQVEALITTEHFREGYKLKASDRTCLAWYRLGLRDGEREHGITGGRHGTE